MKHVPGQIDFTESARIFRFVLDKPQSEVANLIEELVLAIDGMVSAHTGPKMNDEGRKYRAVQKARAAVAKATGSEA